MYKVRALANKLALRGHLVTIMTADTSHLLSHRHQIHLREMERGINVIHLRSLFRYRATTVNPAVWEVGRREVQHADLIHIFGFYDMLGPVVARLAQMYTVPYLLEPIGMLVPIVRSIGKKRLYNRWVGRRVVEGAARVVATSLQEEAEIIQSGISSDLIVVRRNGIDLAEFSNLPERGLLRRRFDIAANERMVLFLSRLSPKKNPDLLMRAFGNLKITDARLVIAGPDESGYLKRLKNLASALGIASKVVFTGPLYGQDKLSALVDADIFVLPSRNENFGNVVAESIAVGTPVVVTDKCGIAPHVREKAGLVVPVVQHAIEDALARLLYDQALYRRLCDGCKHVARELTWEEPVDQLQELYRALIVEKPSCHTSV